MTLLKAIIMGIIQGLTEFLPVSSSGHLAIFKHILKINTDTGLLFDIMLHFGTLVAIIVAFWEDFRQLVMEGISLVGDLFYNLYVWIGKPCGKNPDEYRTMMKSPYRRFVILILISTIPTGVIGVLAKDFIEQMSATVLVPGLCLILTGIELVIADHLANGEKDERKATMKDAVLIGVSQAIATLPGLSRSGTTVTTCLSRQFQREFAVKYSFLMSIPAVLGATLFEVMDLSESTVQSSELMPMILGTIVAAVVGFFCIKTMLVIVKQKKFTYFAVYCFIVGCIAVGYTIIV